MRKNKRWPSLRFCLLGLRMAKMKTPVPDAMVAGDVFANDRYPMIDVAAGGSMQAVLDGLNDIVDLAIPEFRNELLTIRPLT